MIDSIIINALIERSLRFAIALCFCIFLYAIGSLVVSYSKGERIVITVDHSEASTECTQAASCPNVVPES